MEMYPDIGVDPCELSFREYKDVDVRELPFEIEVRYGDQTYGILQLDDYQLTAKVKEDA